MSRHIRLFPVQILAIGFGLIILIGASCSLRPCAIRAEKAFPLSTACLHRRRPHV